MADTYDGPFGGYVAPTGPITQTIQDQIIVEINKLKALIPNQTATASVSAAHPDFDQIPPHTAAKLRTEIDALITAIDATAIS